MTADHRIPLNGAYNFRDLGGYPTTEGRITRWGRLFRSDALHQLTPADTEAVTALGIQTVIDLRTPFEITRTGRGPLTESDVVFIETSVTREGSAIDTRPESTPGVDPLVDRYLAYLDEGGPAFVRALRVIATPKAYPMVFSCFFGKDRSGVLAALVLGCLEVTNDAIVDDYVLSEPSMTLIIDRLRRDPIYRETIERTPSDVFSTRPQTMRLFLAELERRHGGPRRWARAAGLSDDEIDSLRRCLLE